MPLWLRSVAMTLLFPVMVAGVFPWLIATGNWRLPLQLGPGHWLGILPLTFGLAVLGLTIFDFATIGRGTLAPWDAPLHLVRQRLYAWVRNPMYLGVLACILGQAILWAAGEVFIYFAVAAFGFHLRVVAFEEPVLRRQFGQVFDDYMAKVPRWLPRPPRGSPGVG